MHCQFWQNRVHVAALFSSHSLTSQSNARKLRFFHRPTTHCYRSQSDDIFIRARFELEFCQFPTDICCCCCYVCHRLCRALALFGRSICEKNVRISYRLLLCKVLIVIRLTIRVYDNARALNENGRLHEGFIPFFGSVNLIFFFCSERVLVVHSTRRDLKYMKKTNIEPMWLCVYLCQQAFILLLLRSFWP